MQTTKVFSVLMESLLDNPLLQELKQVTQEEIDHFNATASNLDHELAEQGLFKIIEPLQPCETALLVRRDFYSSEYGKVNENGPDEKLMAILTRKTYALHDLVDLLICHRLSEKFLSQGITPIHKQLRFHKGNLVSVSGEGSELRLLR